MVGWGWWTGGLSGGGDGTREMGGWGGDKNLSPCNTLLSNINPSSLTECLSVQADGVKA